jgi:hypothetical protein
LGSTWSPTSGVVPHADVALDLSQVLFFGLSSQQVDDNTRRKIVLMIGNSCRAQCAKLMRAVGVMCF